MGDSDGWSAGQPTPTQPTGENPYRHVEGDVSARRGRYRGRRRASWRRQVGPLLVNAAVSAVVAAVTVVIIHSAGQSTTSAAAKPAPSAPSTSPPATASPSPSRSVDDTIAKPSIRAVPTPTGTAFLSQHASDLPTLLPADGKQVVLGVWSMRRSAMRHRSVKELQAVERGAALSADTDALACECGSIASLTPIASSAVVPLAKGYPADFLGEVEFALPDGSKGVELMVIERATPSDTWHVTLASGFPVDDQYAAEALDSTQWAGDVGTPLGADGKGLTELAALWQATKDGGKPAATDVFGDGSYFTGDYLKELAKTRQDAVQPNGLRAHFSYAPDPSTRTFAVEASTGDLACGALKQTTTYAPSSGHVIKQDDARVAFGASLAPGSYTSVTETVEWEICIEQDGGGKKVVLAWDQSFDPGVAGARVAAGSRLTPDPAQKIVPDTSSDGGSGGAPSTT